MIRKSAHKLRMRLQSQPVIDYLWGGFRAHQLLSEYRAHRRHYAAIVPAKKLIYSEEGVQRLLQTRLPSVANGRGKRPMGKVRTAAFLASHSWHGQLLPDLREMGPLVHYDYLKAGCTFPDLYRRDGRAAALRSRINKEFVDKVVAAHSGEGLDWVFVYGNGYEIERAAIARIREKTGIPCVLMSLDDKHSWVGDQFGGQRSGIVDLVGEFDLVWTSSSSTCTWHLAEGGRPLFLPEGHHFTSTPHLSDPLYGASFVGSAYGFRRAVVRTIAREGFPISVFGDGWGERSFVDKPEDIYRSSLINIGMGGIGYAENLNNLKGRDFEVPASGGGVYLTSYNPDLANFFSVGSEILCYRSVDELAEMIAHYSDRPDECRAIAARGHARALREHRWVHRFQRVCRFIGLL